MSTLFADWRRTLLVVFCSALAARLMLIFMLQDGYYFPDSIFYSDAAISLLTKGELGEIYHRGPVYPAFLAAVYFLLGQKILYIRIVESFLGAGLAVGIAVLARRVAGHGAGAVAGLLWSFYPIAIFLAGLVYPTGLATMLLAGGALFLFSDPQQALSKMRVFIAGVLWGLATLTVPMVLATLGLVSIWLLYWGRPHRFALVTLLIAGSAVTLVPWTIRNYAVYDRLVLIEPRLVKNLPSLKPYDQTLPKDKVAAIVRRPDIFVRRFGREFLRFWQPYPDGIKMSKPGTRERVSERKRSVVRSTIFRQGTLTTVVSILTTGPMFVFAIIGSVAMWLRRERRRDLSLLWVIILSFAAGYSLFYAQSRYRIPIEPYLMVLCAYGLTQTWLFLRPFIAHLQVGRSENTRSVETV
jgi:4-amino-4-deoxy-L-arabinose transferase-like glycosyltransferase